MKLSGHVAHKEKMASDIKYLWLIRGQRKNAKPIIFFYGDTKRWTAD
jgi:hypothetical protein